MDRRQLHQAAGELFREVLDLPDDERGRVLADARQETPDVVAEVHSLLEHHAEDAFLEQPPDDVVTTARMPERIGSYRLLRPLGSGGSGVVWLAEQERPRREVALKLLRWDVASPTLLERFEREADVLAELDHPGIARVLEAGQVVGPTGPQPFLVLEYVDGTPLLEHAATLELPERIALAARIAEIVEHAHRRGIVHRDLKPANVLIQADGSPVVLDFGIARRVAEEDGSRAFPGFDTVTGEVLGTLAYMSPEQASGHDVTERTDVYSLGVLTYEVLAGRLPYDTRQKLITEAIKVIEQVDPTPISHYGEQFEGDLQTVVSMALRKEPERRYATAGELAADLRRVLESRPVHARPPSRLYVAARFVRRQRRLVAGAAVVLAALSIALVVSLASARSARAAERRAELDQAATLRLADRLMVDALVADVDALWPTTPSNLARFDGWLAAATDVVGRRDRHAADAARGDGAGLEPADASALTTLVSDLDAFAADGGTLEAIRERRELAARLEEKTVQAYDAEWSAAIARIRSHADYGGLELAPQVGLVPLGPDPESGLEEFSLYEPNEVVPVRDATSGELVLEPETPLVLVLLPGGTFLFGSQKDDPDAPQHDPRTRDHESPPEPITLAPFFLSKYEMTQAQWLRVMDDNPSYHAVGDRLHDVIMGPLTPVESIRWEQAVEALARLGLVLPTEARWEYAARGGTQTPWWTGTDPEEARRAEHVAGRYHLPIGSRSANPFGLHDMLGNLTEWCLDVFKVDCRAWPVREGDGLRLTPPGRERVVRGGSWTRSPESSRSARRDDMTQSGRMTTVRPARAIDPR